MKFLITYFAAGLPKYEFPLAENRIEHHASCLRSDLERDDALRGFVMKVTTILAGESSSAEVEFSNTQDPDAVRLALADSLRRINERTAGLCFVMEQLP